MCTYIPFSTGTTLSYEAGRNKQNKEFTKSAKAKFLQPLILLCAGIFLTMNAIAGNPSMANMQSTHTDLRVSTGVQVTVTNGQCTDTGSISLSQPGAASWSFIIIDSNKNTVSSGVVTGGGQENISLAAGSYTLTLTDSSGQTISEVVDVAGAVYAPPVADFQITTLNSLVAVNKAETGQQLNFTATIGQQAAYRWNFGDGIVDSDGVTSTIYNKAGSYQVSLFVINPAGCVATSQQTLNIEEATAVQNVQGDAAPAIWSTNNTVYVDFRRVSGMDATINIYDVLGRELSSERSTQLLYQKQIDNVSAGYFIVAVNNQQKTITQKVFIGNTR